MRTLVHVTAHADGRIVHRAEGALAVRQTGGATVHLAGTAAGPLGGDEVRVELHVLAGARLRVRTVAASVVLTGRSCTVWQLEVAPDGCLEVCPEPTVVTAQAVHRNEVRAVLDPGAGLLLIERVQLGRAGEAPGAWTGLLHVDRAGRPLLRHETTLGPGDVLGPATALTSTLRVPDDTPAGVLGAVVVLPLAGGGTLTTELRDRL